MRFTALSLPFAFAFALPAVAQDAPPTGTAEASTQGGQAPASASTPADPSGAATEGGPGQPPEAATPDASQDSEPAGEGQSPAPQTQATDEQAPGAPAGGEQSAPAADEPGPGPVVAGEGQAASDEEPELPSPGELSDRLQQDLPDELQTRDPWTAPVPVFTLHGYMRLRAELFDTLWLSLPEVTDGGPDPFSRWRPVERRAVSQREGDDKAAMLAERGLSTCADEDPGEGGGTGPAGPCDVDTLQFASMRLRLTPQLNLSEDVRVKATFDVFDNRVAGTPPAGFYGTGEARYAQAAATTTFAATTVPATDSIVARRAWAEVRNRDLGELRFGRMPQHWGLGMLYNAGNQLDDDYSTDVDRIMGITNLFGFYITAAYDFIAEGLVNSSASYAPGLDASQLDDVDQFSLSVARRLSEEDQAAALQRGELVFNVGAHMSLRNQDALLLQAEDDSDEPMFVPLSATYYVPDLWAQLMWQGVRIELEAAWVLGSLSGANNSETGVFLDKDVSQLGLALETEFRFLEDQLGIYFYAGLATGDSDIEGLSSDVDYITEGGTGNNKLHTFRFHPSYRIDQILWRQIMRQVTGAYYFRPGLSYDFVRDSFGQLFGARLDVIWSRAAAPAQTPGNATDLGIELNGSIYWRSEDGPDLFDGYHASFTYGVLFPFDGLHQADGAEADTGQTLRLLLGVVY